MLAALCTCSTGYTSTLLGTPWRLKLDVGLEPGSWMPRKIDGWGASGARVLVDAVVEFDAAPAGESEELVGPLDQTRTLTVRGGGTIVTFEGEQEVTFRSGGWCVQRPLLSKSTEQEGLLRFWIDCPSGCAKNDVSVPPGERLFFSTGVWDDADGVRTLRAKATATAAQLGALESEAETVPGGASAESDDLLDRIPVFGPMRRKFLRIEQMATLRRTRAYHESWPGLDEERVALIADKGSLSLKQERPRGYIFLGKFGAEPLPSSAGGGSREDAAPSPRGGTPVMGLKLRRPKGKGGSVATASHILLKERQVALQLLERIERGEISFVAAANKFSTCGSAATGGALGSFKVRSYPPLGTTSAWRSALCAEPARGTT